MRSFITTATFNILRATRTEFSFAEGHYSLEFGNYDFVKPTRQGLKWPL